MTMPKEVVTALTGMKLSGENFLKIDGTALADVLAEEEGYEPIEYKSPQKDFNEDPFTTDEDKKDDKVDDFDLYSYIKENQNLEPKEEKGENEETNESKDLQPYEADLECLDDRFNYIATLIRIRKKEKERDEASSLQEKHAAENVLRELLAKKRVLNNKYQRRKQITSQKGFLPRIVRLARIRKLQDFDEMILLYLVGSIVSQDMALALGNDAFSGYRNCVTVGTILYVLCDDLKERIDRRSHFYNKSCLVRDGMIDVEEKSTDDLFDCSVNIDRRMMDYIVGIDSELDEIVQGSTLYKPAVTVDNVILPPDKKQIIVDTVANFSNLKKMRARLGFQTNEQASGGGLILLFYGISGTGKTMMANALADYLGKRILTINYSAIKSGSSILRFIFRECKINDAVLFLDECEGFFENRDHKFNPDVSGFLAQIDKHEGIIIMATNRAYDLDEATHRRIQLAVEFTPPDIVSRQKIWIEHLPTDVDKTWLASDVDTEKLALDYELTGGLIRNAAVQALSFAAARDSNNVVVKHQDLEKAARLQLKGISQSNTINRTIIPKRALSEIVLDEITSQRIREIIDFDKVKNLLYGRWGFNNTSTKGTSVLVTGPTGTGKSMVAEVIAYELGTTLKIVDVTSILARYAFNTSSNIHQLFKESKEANAIIVLEFGTGDVSQSPESTIDPNLSNLLHNIETYDGVIIMITDNMNVDNTLLSRFRFAIELKTPDLEQRTKLWRACTPSQVPLESDVDFAALAKKYSHFSGGNIYNSVFRACSKAAVNRNMTVNMALFIHAADDESKLITANQWRTNSTKHLYN
jgi:SpoVK/Ycf46/Vps4 family AAA+-type ATPase